MHVAKNVEVQKLIKGRPLDNLEFLQWMKRYYDTATGGGGGGKLDVRRRGATGVRAGRGGVRGRAQGERDERTRGTSRRERSGARIEDDDDDDDGAGGASQARRRRRAGRERRLGRTRERRRGTARAREK